MPLTITENIVHQNADGVPTSGVGTPVTVALAGADETEDDSVVFVWLSGTGNLSWTVPSGWRVVYHSGATVNSNACFYRSSDDGLVGGESSWNFAPATTGGGLVAWVVAEIVGLDPTEVLDGVPVGATNTGAGTDWTVLASRTTSYDGLVLIAHAFFDADNATPPTWGSHIEGFTEVVEVGQAGTGNSLGQSISALPVKTIAQFFTTATASRTFQANEATARVFTVLARNAPRLSDRTDIDGAERGNTTGLPGTIVGGVTIASGAARSGSYGYQYASAAAACHYTEPTFSAISLPLGSYPTRRRCFRVTDLTDRELWRRTVTTASGGTITTVVRLVSGQVGVQVTGNIGTSGGEQLSDTTVTVDQWFAVEVRIDTRLRPAYKADWSVDYNAELTDTTPAVVQTDATLTGGNTGALAQIVDRTGWATSITATMHVDDTSGGPGWNWPIGDLRVIPLKVDPAGTPTVTVATTNFGVMTANGSVAAWNAVNARNAVDDIPPIPAGDGARDAAVALLAHATDTANFPMETHDLAANKVNVRGVKAHWWVWAASATTATIRVFVTDGTTVYTVYAVADPNADNVTTVYGSALLRPSTADPTEWTQARVDGLTFQFGSNDATPDIGLDAVLLELAVVKALPEDLFGQVGEPIYVEAHRDPNMQALVGATVTNLSGEAIELAWEVDGVPDSSGSIPDGTVEQYVPLSPDGTIETVGKVSVIPG